MFEIAAGMLSENNVENNEKYSIAKFEFGQYRTRFQLTINDFDEQDTGLYKCICKNTQSGRVEGDVRVKILPGELSVATNKNCSYVNHIDC